MTQWEVGEVDSSPKQYTSLEVRACANGYVVTPPPFRESCPVSLEDSMYVFPTFDDLVGWLRGYLKNPRPCKSS